VDAQFAWGSDAAVDHWLYVDTGLKILTVDRDTPLLCPPITYNFPLRTAVDAWFLASGMLDNICHVSLEGIVSFQAVDGCLGLSFFHRPHTAFHRALPLRRRYDGQWKWVPVPPTSGHRCDQTCYTGYIQQEVVHRAG
jgi:hypothetical protein